VGCARFVLGYPTLGTVQVMMFAVCLVILFCTFIGSKQTPCIVNIRHRFDGSIVNVLPEKEPTNPHTEYIYKECCLTILGGLFLCLASAVAIMALATPVWWIVDIFRIGLGYVKYADGTGFA